MWVHMRCCCCCIYIWACVSCVLLSATVLELGFSNAEIRRFSKANGRLSATSNTSLLNLILPI